MIDGSRMFAYSLAKELGIWDVESWLERIGMRQFKLWQVYEQMLANERNRNRSRNGR